MFSFLESTPEELLAAEERLGELAGEIFDGLYEPGVFVRLVKQGAFQASTVQIQGETTLVFIHSRNPLGWLIVEGVASLKHCPVKTVFGAVEELGRRLNCRVIQFVTKLAALGRGALGAGYQSDGIIFHKNVALPAS